MDQLEYFEQNLCSELQLSRKIKGNEEAVHKRKPEEMIKMWKDI